MKHRLGALLLGLMLGGCVSRQAGYGELREDVNSRVGKDVRWFHLDGTRAAEQRIRELVKRPLDQEAAVQIALLNNPRMQAEFERIGMARSDLVAAWKLPNPRLGADAVFYGESSDPELRMDLTLSLTRLLSMPSRVSTARSGLERAKLEVLGATLDLSFEVRQALIAYQVERSVLGLLRKQTGASNASYVAAKRLHEAGNLNDLELATERAAYEEARLAVAEAEQSERAAKLALGHLLGFWQLGTDFRVKDQLPALPEPSPGERMTQAAAEKAALKSSVDLAMQRASFAEATGRANVATLSGALPDVSAGVGVERQDDAWGVGPAVHLEIPLFDQGQGAAARAESERRQARAHSAVTAADVRSAVRRVRSQLSMARDAASHYQETVLPLRREISRETLLAYNAMSVGIFELMAARRAEFAAGARALRAQGKYWMLRYELDQLLSGRLPMASLTPTKPLTGGAADSASGPSGH